MDCFTYLKAIVFIEEPHRSSDQRRALKRLLGIAKRKKSQYQKRFIKSLAIEKLEGTFWR